MDLLQIIQTFCKKKIYLKFMLIEHIYPLFPDKLVKPSKKMHTFLTDLKCF